jgi:hypothetical protein
MSHGWSITVRLHLCLCCDACVARSQHVEFLDGLWYSICLVAGGFQSSCFFALERRVVLQ